MLAGLPRQVVTVIGIGIPESDVDMAVNTATDSQSAFTFHYDSESHGLAIPARSIPPGKRRIRSRSLDLRSPESRTSPGGLALSPDGLALHGARSWG
jgi:hypothetical protein